jgi:hypothetical protein
MAQYSNFKDPVGLVWRMLASGKPAARDALLRAGMTLAVTPVDWLLQFWEQRIINRYTAEQGVHVPMVLVVGPPRSGSTLVYQILAQGIPCSIFTNFSSLFPQAPLIASWCYQRIQQRVPTGFQSFYGNTAGLGQVNDGFHVWNRWLGEDRYDVPTHWNSERQAQIRQFFAAWSSIFPQPFLNKNNRNSLCLKDLIRTFPKVILVAVHRDPLYIAQSLLLARENVQGSRQVGWGLAAKPHKISEDPLQSVVDQVVRIQSRYRAQLETLPSSQVISVQYQEFCANPNHLVAQVYCKLFDRDWETSNHARNLPPFQHRNVRQLPEPEFGQLRDYLNQALGMTAKI